MAYCRRSETSDVYMYGHVDGYIHCGLCSMSGVSTTIFSTRSAAIRHLRKHRDQGDKVPDGAFDKLIEDIATSGDLV